MCFHRVSPGSVPAGTTKLTISGVKPVDVEYLRRLSRLTNIIPLISRSDLLSEEELSSLKENIISAFHASSIRPFNLEASSGGSAEAPYAISSMASKDHETMDASLLMSQDYVQPLLASELSQLVARIFERDTVSHLRHSAGKKFVQWRDTPPLDNLHSPLGRPLLPPTSALGAAPSYALARVSDYTQREDIKAQVRLSHWAAELQRSLAHERARFASLAQGERAVWLTERLGECVHDGTIVAVQRGGTVAVMPSASAASSSSSSLSKRTAIDRRDPLGLLQLHAEVKRQSWAALQVVGSVGVLGGLAYYITRSWQAAADGEGVWEWVMHAL